MGFTFFLFTALLLIAVIAIIWPLLPKAGKKIEKHFSQSDEEDEHK